jgi:hypothetical protein
VIAKAAEKVIEEKCVEKPKSKSPKGRKSLKGKAQKKD